MARVSGLVRSTSYRSLSDIHHTVSAPPGRVRKKRGGGKKKTL